MILRKLDYCNLINDVWSYLTVNDIICLLRTSKDVRNLSVRLNKRVRCSLTIQSFEGKPPVENKERIMIIINLLNTFPNIHKLTFLYTWYNSVPVGQRKELGMGTTIMNLLYGNNNFIGNIRDLTIRIRDEKAFHGMNKLIHLTSLDLSDSSIISIAEIKSLTNLTSLNISKCRKIKTEGLLYLNSFVLLSDLSISHLYLEMTDLVLSKLVYLTKITSLDMSYSTNITHNGIVHLNKLINLKSLNLSDCYHITDTCLMQLSSLMNISYLNLESCDITNNGINNFPLFNISSLNLSKCKNISEFALSFLPKSGYIELMTLDMSNCKISDKCIGSLCALVNIKTFKIFNCELITNIGLSIIFQLLLNLENFGFTWFLKTVNNGAFNNIDYTKNLKNLEIKLERFLTTIQSVDDEYLSDITIEKLINLESFIVPDVFKEKEGVKGLAYVRNYRNSYIVSKTKEI